ncbi:DUF211 domain-containing protein [Candidatus Bathyarchaeota archaeon]|nr:DUF211 domain-containing protein [Candidatus Bathyarchaeota archaeon]
MSFIIKRVVLDVLKPHEPPIHEFAKRLGEIPHITTVDISTQAIDDNTQTIRITIEGNEIRYDEIDKKITELGASIHSVDKVTASKPKSSKSNA